MTNKEAIEVLNMVNKQSKNQPHEFYEALYIAINALEKIDDMICKNCDSGYAQGYSDGYLKGKEGER